MNRCLLRSKLFGDLLKLADQSAVKNVRFIGVTCTLNSKPSNIFNIQDEEDFKKRVVGNAKPVIVDFHAVLVQIMAFFYLNFFL